MYRDGEIGKRGNYFYFIRKFRKFNYIDIFHKDGSFNNVKRGSRPQLRWFDSWLGMVATSLLYIYNLGSWMSGLVSGLQNQPHPFESGTALSDLYF